MDLTVSAQTSLDSLFLEEGAIILEVFKEVYRLEGGATILPFIIFVKCDYKHLLFPELIIYPRDL